MKSFLAETELELTTSESEGVSCDIKSFDPKPVITLG